MPMATPAPGTDPEKTRAVSQSLANPEVYDDRRATGESRGALGRGGFAAGMTLALLLGVAAFWWPFLAGRPGGARVGDKAALRLAAAGTLGAGLAPALAETFLESQGAADVQRTAGAGDAVTVVGTVPGEAGPQAIEVRSSADAQAFTALASGHADVVLASRPAAPGELAPLAAAGSAPPAILGVGGVAVVVNPYNPVRSLTLDQLRGIWSGRIEDWSEVGGSRGAIVLYAPGERSAAAETLADLVLLDRRLAMSAHRLTDDRAVAAKVAGDLYGLGVVGLSGVGNARAIEISREGGAATAPVAPVPPTQPALLRGDYPLSRRLYLYTSPAAGNSLRSRFVAFLEGEAGRRLIGQAGFLVPPPPAGAAPPAVAR